MVSRAASGEAVCTGGDSYRAMVASGSLMHFVALSQPVADAPGVYWMNTSVSARLPGQHTFTVSLTLVETVRRGLQPAAKEALGDWLRVRQCLWQPVPLSTVSVQVSSPPPTRPLPRCRAVPPASELAYVAVDAGGADSCAGWCTGDATARVLNTSNERRYAARQRQGFRHVLTASGCTLHWHGEAEVAACLGGRTLLHAGSAAAVDLQRGWAQLNTSLAAWTRVRPGPQHPNVADFWRAYLKEGGSYCYKRRKCAIRFGAGEVLMRYPTLRGGLRGLLAKPDSVAELQVTPPSSRPPTPCPRPHLTSPDLARSPPTSEPNVRRRPCRLRGGQRRLPAVY